MGYLTLINHCRKDLSSLMSHCGKDLSPWEVSLMSHCRGALNLPWGFEGRLISCWSYGPLYPGS